MMKRVRQWLKWKRVCAWCDRRIGGNPLARRFTHGICESCNKDFYKRNGLALLLLCALPVMGMGRFDALAQVETGGRDKAVGLAGEVSRYQISPAVWRANSRLPIAWATNEEAALEVAVVVMAKRERQFVKRKHCKPDAFEWALLWHCPNRKRYTAADLDYACRFCNLLSKP